MCLCNLYFVLLVVSGLQLAINWFAADAARQDNKYRVSFLL